MRGATCTAGDHMNGTAYLDTFVNDKLLQLDQLPVMLYDLDEWR